MGLLFVLGPGTSPGAAVSPAATDVSAGQLHSCAWVSDGSAWCWGNNLDGALGNGRQAEWLPPVRVAKVDCTILGGVTAVSAGSGHSCARTKDGGAWCWGNNLDGALGNGTVALRLPAVRVTGSGGEPLAGVTAVSAGGMDSCARTSDGAAWCWGGNAYGQVGDGSTTDRRRAVRVTKAGGGDLTGVVEVAAGHDHSCARTSDGGAWCWGGNAYGQVGDGTTSERHRALRVTRGNATTLDEVTSIDAGSNHGCAARGDGGAWCWGGNAYGQVGDGTVSQRRVRALRVVDAWAVP